MNIAKFLEQTDASDYEELSFSEFIILRSALCRMHSMISVSKDISLTKKEVDLIFKRFPEVRKTAFQYSA